MDKSPQTSSRTRNDIKQGEKEVEKCVPKAWAVLDFLRYVFEVMVHRARQRSSCNCAKLYDFPPSELARAFDLSDDFEDSGSDGPASLHLSSKEHPSSLRRKWYSPLFKIPEIWSLSLCIRFATPRKYWRSLEASLLHALSLSHRKFELDVLSSPKMDARRSSKLTSFALRIGRNIPAIGLTN